MGISDDIQLSGKKVSARHKVPKVSDEDVKILVNHDETTDKPEDFFGDRKEAEEMPRQNHERTRRFMPLFLWLIAITLGSVLVYQNFSFVKSKFNTIFGSDEVKINSAKTVTSPSTTSSETKDSLPATTGSAIAPDTAAVAVPATPAIVKSAITMKVLNGSGINGLAAKIKTTLETAGFAVAYVGNAKSFSYATTIIYYKTGKIAEANLVKDALSSRTVSVQLSDTIVGTYDLVVVIGKS